MNLIDPGGLVIGLNSPSGSTKKSALPKLPPLGHQRISINDRNQELMLVYDVEIVKTVQRAIPSLIGFYVVNNEIGDFRRMSLYISCINLSYKFLAPLIKREFNIPIGGIVSFGSNVPDCHIKGCMEVVNNIADDQRHFIGQRCSYVKMELMRSALKINLSPKMVNICLDVGVQDRIKLKDVLIGPFDF